MRSRRETKKVYIGKVPVGGGAPISVQSMTNTRTKDVTTTVEQIEKLTRAGCDIIRTAVPDMESARKLSFIREKIEIPLIADIHFNYKLALEAISRGVDGLRINPGNIGKEENVIKVVKSAKKAGIPIRIGVNSGSIADNLLKKYGHPTAAAMVESAENHINILEKNDFKDIIISLKATDIWMTIKAHELLAPKIDYPFHIGITEAGSKEAGTIKSAVGIGSLLTRGFGDTIRISLTGDPLEEVKVGREILKSLNLRNTGPTLISCPTCGRTRINLIDLVEKVEARLKNVDKNITVAVMGCEVNGPGEAREADIGIAGAKNKGFIFKKGELIQEVTEDKLVDTLFQEIKKM